MSCQPEDWRQKRDKDRITGDCFEDGAHDFAPKYFFE
jgi:hypothetical protein